MITEKELIKKLKAFIKDKRKPIGTGWPEVKVGTKDEEGDVRALYDIVYDIIRLKFGTDCDGDVPIDVDLVDRTRFEAAHVIHIPYGEDADEDKRLDILYRAMGNVQIATERVNNMMKVMLYNKHVRECEEEKKMVP